MMRDVIKFATNEKRGECLVAELRTDYNAETEKQAMDVLENLVARYSSEATTVSDRLYIGNVRSQSIRNSAKSAHHRVTKPQ